MNSVLNAILFTFALSISAETIEISPNERRIFKLYAMAALFELCHDKVISKRCAEINAGLDTLEPEIFFFQNEEKREILVIYTLNDSYPDVILRYDKDGNIKIVNRGIWLSDKQGYIREFLNSGNYIDENHAE